MLSFKYKISNYFSEKDVNFLNNSLNVPKKNQKKPAFLNPLFRPGTQILAGFYRQVYWLGKLPVHKTLLGCRVGRGRRVRASSRADKMALPWWSFGRHVGLYLSTSRKKYSYDDNSLSLTSSSTPIKKWSRQQRQWYSPRFRQTDTARQILRGGGGGGVN